MMIFAGVLVVQGAGRQQLEADDGAGEGHRRADQEALAGGVTEQPRHRPTHQREHQRGAEGDQGGLAQHLQQPLRRQVQPQQEQQEHDADLGHFFDGRGVGDQFESVGPDEDAEYDVGDRQRLACVQRQRGEQRRAGENQEQRKNDGVLGFVHLLLIPGQTSAASPRVHRRCTNAF